MKLRYVECPRDSWQGLNTFIPTMEKITYLQSLLDSGFTHLDMGSFVSPTAVPQLADTEAVLAKLEPSVDVDLLAIVANERGLERAHKTEKLTSIGYPLSVNDTFQKRNTNRSLANSWDLVAEMQQGKGHLNLVIYLSMGFGNPYGEDWKVSDTARSVDKLRSMGIARIVLADTVGSATAELIRDVLKEITDPQDLGLHLHAKPNDWQDKLERALDYGVSWFEGAFAGIGGCPFAEDTMVGNLATEAVLPFLEKARNVNESYDLRPATRASEIAVTYS